MCLTCFIQAPGPRSWDGYVSSNMGTGKWSPRPQRRGRRFPIALVAGHWGLLPLGCGQDRQLCFLGGTSRMRGVLPHPNPARVSGQREGGRRRPQAAVAAQSAALEAPLLACSAPRLR